MVQPNQLMNVSSAIFTEMKSEYQEYNLKHIDQLLVIQRAKNHNK